MLTSKSSNQLSEQSQEYNSKLRELFQCFDIIQDYRVLPHYIRKGEENMIIMRINVSTLISLLS